MLFALITTSSWLLNLKLFVSPTLTNIFCPQFSVKWDLRRRFFHRETMTSIPLAIRVIPVEDYRN